LINNTKEARSKKASIPPLHTYKHTYTHRGKKVGLTRRRLEDQGSLQRQDRPGQQAKVQKGQTCALHISRKKTVFLFCRVVKQCATCEKELGKIYRIVYLDWDRITTILPGHQEHGGLRWWQNLGINITSFFNIFFNIYSKQSKLLMIINCQNRKYYHTIHNDIICTATYCRKFLPSVHRQSSRPRPWPKCLQQCLLELPRRCVPCISKTVH
jgi:hypothetical protein